MIRFCGYPIEACIFDMDGTILDSTELWDHLLDVVMDTMGYTPKKTIHEDTFPYNAIELAEFLKKDYDMKESAEEIYDLMDHCIDKYYHESAHLKPGALSLLSFLHDRNIPITLATATLEKYAIPAMKLTGAFPYFDNIIAIDKVGVGKRAPAFFDAVLREIGSEPAKTLVFEDALYSITNAVALGMKTCGVYDEGAEFIKPEIQAITDFYLDDLSNWEKIPFSE